MSSSETTAEGPHTTETTMQDPTEAPPQDQQSLPSPEEALSGKFGKMKLATPFKIWPPSQRTRDAVVNRLIETLSTPSVLSKRYGTMSAKEASATAKLIEEEAFTSADAVFPDGADDDSLDGGIEILQVYSKEISARVLQAVKRKYSAAPDGGDEVAVATEEVGSGEGDVVAPVTVSDEVSSADNESSSA